MRLHPLHPRLPPSAVKYWQLAIIAKQVLWKFSKNNLNQNNNDLNGRFPNCSPPTTRVPTNRFMRPAVPCCIYIAVLPATPSNFHGYILRWFLFQFFSIFKEFLSAVEERQCRFSNNYVEKGVWQRGLYKIEILFSSNIKFVSVSVSFPIADLLKCRLNLFIWLRRVST